MFNMALDSTTQQNKEMKMKIKRNVVSKNWHDLVEEIYAGGAGKDIDDIATAPEKELADA